MPEAATHRRSLTADQKTNGHFWRITLEYRSGFAREAHAVAQLDHPNIIAIYDYGIVGEESEGHRRRGETNEALRLLRSALQASEEAGNRFSSGIVLNILGETARAVGDWETAEHHYRRAAAIFRAIGSPFESVLYANIGLVLLAKDDLEGARPLLEDCIASLRRSRSRGFLPYLSAAMLPCVAAKDEWDLWDAHLQEVVDGRALGIVDHDIAWALEKGAAAAFARHEKVRGRAAVVEAITQLRGVQEEARAEALAKTLENEGD